MTKGRQAAARAALGIMALLAACAACARPLKLAVQPILSEQATRRAFTPLARYIGHIMGRHCVVAVSPNFLAYWQNMRRPHNYAFVLDAAHFTDFRLTHMGYHLLVREPGTQSYSLVVRSSEMVFGPSDLIGLPVATLGVPSMGAALLDRLFPHATRQPITIDVHDAAQGLALLKAHKVAAAMIPTSLIGIAMAHGANLNVVTTTPPVPNVALSAAPWIAPSARARLRHALLHTPRGLMHDVGLPRFVAATRAQYRGQDRILKKYWGY